MTPAENIAQTLRQRFPAAEIVLDEAGGGIPSLAVGTADLIPVLTILRGEFEFESLMCETASDKKDCIQVIYHICSTPRRLKLAVRVRLSREEPSLETAGNIWKAARWYEREIFDLFGVVFLGHGNLSRILLPPDWEGHPLRKDYTPAPEYHRMKIEC